MKCEREEEKRIKINCGKREDNMNNCFKMLPCWYNMATETVGDLVIRLTDCLLRFWEATQICLLVGWLEIDFAESTESGSSLLSYLLLSLSGLLRLATNDLNTWLSLKREDLVSDWLLIRLGGGWLPWFSPMISMNRLGVIRQIAIAKGFQSTQTWCCSHSVLLLLTLAVLLLFPLLFPVFWLF